MPCQTKTFPTRKARTRGFPFWIPPSLPPSEFFSAGLRDSCLFLLILSPMEMNWYGGFPLLTYWLLLEPFNEHCNEPKEDPPAQHYSTCGVSHTLQTTTAAVTSLVPHLTKSLAGWTTPKANSALGADPTPTGWYSRAVGTDLVGIRLREAHSYASPLCKYSRVRKQNLTSFCCWTQTYFRSTRTCRSIKLKNQVGSNGTASKPLETVTHNNQSTYATL